MPRYTAAIDVGTTRVKLRVYDPGDNWRLLYSEDHPTPKHTLTLHDPHKLAQLVEHLAKKAREKGAKTLGLATYRGSLLVWKNTSLGPQPLTPIHTWLDTTPWKLKAKWPLQAKIASHAPKLKQILQPETLPGRLYAILHEKPSLRRELETGNAYAWNIDAYLLHKLNGEPKTTPGIAGLTGIIHPKNLETINAPLKLLHLPKINTPQIAYTDECLQPTINTIQPDQQAALHGADCLDPTCEKISIGTGTFIDAPTGEEPILNPGHGLIPIIITYPKHGKPLYGIEAIIPGTGITIQKIVEGLLNGDYNKLDQQANQWLQKHQETPQITLTPWGTRHPKTQPTQKITITLNINQITTQAIAAATITQLTNLIQKHNQTIQQKTKTPKTIIITGGLTQLKTLQKQLNQKLKTKTTTKQNLTPEGTAKTTHQNCT